MADRAALYADLAAAARAAFGPIPEPGADGWVRRLAQSDAVIWHVTRDAELRPRDLTDDQLAECAAVCHQIADGELEAVRRTNGRFEIRKPIGAATTRRRAS